MGGATGPGMVFGPFTDKRGTMEHYPTPPPDPTDHFPVEQRKMPTVWLATVAWLLF